MRRLIPAFIVLLLLFSFTGIGLSCRGSATDTEGMQTSEGGEVSAPAPEEPERLPEQEEPERLPEQEESEKLPEQEEPERLPEQEEPVRAPEPEKPQTVSTQTPPEEAPVAVAEVPERAPERQTAPTPVKGPPDPGDVSIRFSTPPDGSFYGPVVSVQGTVTGGVGLVDAAWDVMGTPLSGPVTIDNRGRFSFSFPTKDLSGDIRLRVKTSFEGASLTEGFVDLRDNPEGPAITISEPKAGDPYRSRVPVRGSVWNNPGASGKTDGIESLEYRITGTDRSGPVAFNSSGAFSFFLDTSGLTGILVLEIKATDYRGRISTGAVTLSGDQTGLFLEITEPADGSLYRSVMTVRGRVADAPDALGSTAEVAGLRWFINGTDIGGSIEPSSRGSFSFDLDTLSLPKQAVLTLRAVDRNGRETDRRVFLRDDGVGPSLSVLSPSDGDRYGESVMLQGSVFNRADTRSPEGEVSSVYLEVLERPELSGPVPFQQDGSFSISIPTDSADGELTFELTALDMHGNRSTELLRLMPPKESSTAREAERPIEIDTGTERFEYRSSVRVEGKLSGTSAGTVRQVTWTIRGTDRQGSASVKTDGSFIIEADTRGLRDQRVLLVQASGGGHSASQTVMLTESGVSPTLVLTSPADRSYYQSSFTISGTVSDGQEGKSLSELKSLSWSLTGTEKGGTLKPDPDGKFTLQVSTEGMREDLFLTVAAEDMNGHITEKNITLKDDGTGPYIRILSPKDGDEYGITVVCNGIVRDGQREGSGIAEVRSAEWAIPDTGLGGRLSPEENGEFSFSFSGVGLPETALLRISAADKNGHTSTETLTLRRDTRGLFLSVTSPRDLGYYAESVRVAGQVGDTSSGTPSIEKLKTLSWRTEGLESRGGYVYVEQTGQFSFGIDTGKASGPLQIVLEAEDLFGTKTARTIRLRDGKTPPGIELESPEEGSFYGAGISLEGRIVDPYEGDGEYGGIDRVEYEMLSARFSRDQEKLEGTITVDRAGRFVQPINTLDLREDQHLIVRVFGANGNRGERTVTLKEGGSAIPSFNVVPGNREARVEWDSLPFAESYTLRYLKGLPEALETGGIRNADVRPPLVVPRLENGERYSFLLEAIIAGKRVSSDVIEVIPLATGTLRPRAEGGFEQISLSWNRIPGSERFNVLRSEGGPGDFAALETVEGTSFLDTAVRYGTDYFYRIMPDGVAAPTGSYTEASSLEAPKSRISAVASDTGYSAVSITVRGDYAYVAAGAGGLRILDISDPARSSLWGFFECEDARAVAVDGDLAYLADGGKGLKIINIVDPRNPYMVGNRNTQNAGGIAVGGGYVYLADGAGGLRVLDVRNPASPERLSAVEMTNALDCIIDGAFVYVAAGSQGVRIIDISAPGSPSLKGAFASPDARKVRMKNGYLYVADAREGLLILDVSNPVVPRRVGRMPAPGLRGIDLKEQYAFLAQEGRGLVIVDVLNPENPAVVDEIAFPNAMDAGVKDDIVFLADSGGVRIIRAYLIGKSFRVAGLSLSGTASDVTLSGNRAFVSSNTGGLHLVNISNPPGVKAEAFLRTVSSPYVVSSALRDGFLVLADRDEGVKIYGEPWTGEPEHVVPLESVSDSVFSGSTLFTALKEGGIYMIETEGLEEKKEPVVLDRIGQGSISAMDAGSGVLVAADRNAGVILFSFSAGSLTKTGEFPVRGIKDVTLQGTIVAAAGSDGVVYIDISQPAAPVQTGFYPTRFAEGVRFSGGLLYLCEGYRGLSVLALGDNGRLTRVSTCPDVYALDCAVSGNYAFVCDGTGLSVVKVVIPERFASE